MLAQLLLESWPVLEAAQALGDARLHVEVADAFLIESGHALVDTAQVAAVVVHDLPAAGEAVTWDQNPCRHRTLGAVQGLDAAAEGAVIHAHDASVAGVVPEEQGAELRYLEHQVRGGVDMGVIVGLEGQAAERDGLPALQCNGRAPGHCPVGGPLGGAHHALDPFLAGALRNLLQHLGVGIDRDLRGGRHHGLIAEPVVPVDMGIEDRQQRLVRHLADLPQDHLPGLDAGTRIHHDDPSLGDQEGRVVHESLVLRARIAHGAVNHIEPRGDLIRRIVRQVRPAGRQGGQGQQEQEPGGEGPWAPGGLVAVAESVVHGRCSGGDGSDVGLYTRGLSLGRIADAGLCCGTEGAAGRPASGGSGAWMRVRGPSPCVLPGWNWL